MPNGVWVCNVDGSDSNASQEAMYPDAIWLGKDIFETGPKGKRRAMPKSWRTGEWYGAWELELCICKKTDAPVSTTERSSVRRMSDGMKHGFGQLVGWTHMICHLRNADTVAHYLLTDMTFFVFVRVHACLVEEDTTAIISHHLPLETAYPVIRDLVRMYCLAHASQATS
jgi:hypothetical protein